MARVRFLAEAPPPPRGNAENQLQELRDYLTRVLDEIEFLVQHIGSENLERSLSDEISGKQDALTFDAVPTEGSDNPITSGGVFAALPTSSQAVNSSLDLTLESDTRYLVVVQRLSAALGVYSIVVRANGTVEIMTAAETNSAWTLTASTNTLTIATSTNAVVCSVLRF